MVPTANNIGYLGRRNRENEGHFMDTKPFIGEFAYFTDVFWCQFFSTFIPFFIIFYHKKISFSFSIKHFVKCVKCVKCLGFTTYKKTSCIFLNGLGYFIVTPVTPVTSICICAHIKYIMLLLTTAFNRGRITKNILWLHIQIEVTGVTGVTTRQTAGACNRE